MFTDKFLTEGTALYLTKCRATSSLYVSPACIPHAIPIRCVSRMFHHMIKSFALRTGDQSTADDEGKRRTSRVSSPYVSA